MKCSLLSLVLIASAGLAASANAQSPAIGGATMPRPVAKADPLGPRSVDISVAESVARMQIERNGYSSVRDLTRGADGSWSGMARSPSNAAVQVALDSQGKVSEVR